MQATHTQESKTALELFAPKIHAIQNHLNMINDHLRKREYTKALNEMLLTIPELDPPDQPKKLRNRILTELKAIQRIKTNSIKNRRLRKNQWNYYQYSEELNAHIWNRGYFNVEKYTMTYPSKMSKKQAYKSPLLQPVKA